MNINIIKSTIALASSAILFAGCDIDPMGEKHEERKRAAEERAQEERARQELESQRTAMTKYTTGKRQLLQSRLSEIMRTEKSLRSDLNTLTTIIDNSMSDKDADGKDRKYETKVLRILKNAEVNALASKYLASDFSGIVAIYIERVRDARAADARYAAALDSTESMYKAGIKETMNWSEMSQKQRDEEITRLQKEIRELESARERVLNEYKNVTRNQNSRATTTMRSSANRYTITGDTTDKDRQRGDTVMVLERKVSDYEDQIMVKRNQIDSLRSPRQINRQANEALSTAQRRQMEAVNTRRSALADINRQLKPKKSLTDTIAEFEEKTIGNLRKTISDKINAIDGETNSLKEKIALADEILLAIPLYDQGEIKRQRQKLEGIAVR